jgi:hypothetical protein
MFTLRLISRSVAGQYILTHAREFDPLYQEGLICGLLLYSCCALVSNYSGWILVDIVVYYSYLGSFPANTLAVVI